MAHMLSSKDGRIEMAYTGETPLTPRQADATLSDMNGDSALERVDDYHANLNAIRARPRRSLIVKSPITGTDLVCRDERQADEVEAWAAWVRRRRNAHPVTR